jgi:hypothetical protein
MLRALRTPLVHVTCIVALASCKKKPIEFHRIELPGFSVEVPTFVKAPAKPEYRVGDVERQKFPGKVQVPTMVAISWQPGGILAADEMPATVKILMDQYAPEAKKTYGPIRTTTVGGQRSAQIDAKLDSVDALFADIECGKRSIMLTIATVDDFELVRDRMLKSFICKPIDAEEARLDSQFSVGADDLKIFEGWRYTDEDRSVLNITNGNMVDVFTETPKPDSVDLDGLRGAVPKLFSAFGATFTPDVDGRETRTIPGGERRVYERGKLLADGESMPAVISLWACPERRRAVIALVMVMPDVATSTAIDFVSQVRCAKPGDPPLPIGPYVPEEKPQ